MNGLLNQAKNGKGKSCNGDHLGMVAELRIKRTKNKDKLLTILSSYIINIWDILENLKKKNWPQI